MAKDNAKDNAEVQEKYMMLKNSKENMDKLQEHLKAIGEQLESIEGSLNNIKQISALEQGQGMLVPISNGVFIEATVEKSREFLVNVGSNTVVKKDLAGVVEIIEGQKRELAELQEGIVQELKDTEETVHSLRKELKGMMG